MGVFLTKQQSSGRNWLFLLLLLALVAVVLSGCKSEKEEQRYSGPDTGPAYGDLFIDGSIGDASTLLPPLAMDSSSASIIGLVYNGLVKYDGDLNLVGDLAESWDISPDGLTITFHLRKGVKWHDGAPFTAKDVLFTYQAMVDPKTPTAYSGDYLQVKKAEAPDDYTFRVTYPQPFAPRPGFLGPGNYAPAPFRGPRYHQVHPGAPPHRHRSLYFQRVESGPDDQPGLQPQLF